MQLLDVLGTMQSRMSHDTLCVTDKGLEVLQAMLRAGVHEYLGCQRPVWVAEMDEGQFAQPRAWSRSMAAGMGSEGKVFAPSLEA